MHNSLRSYLPEPENKKVLYTGADGDTADIMTQVLLTYEAGKEQMKELANSLRGDSLMQTCRNIWNVIKKNVRYKVDPPGQQFVKTPARLFADGEGDCKSYSIAIASCLYNLGIKGCFRFVSYNNDPAPTHVYVVVKNQGNEIIIDDVMPAFNKEKAYRSKLDYNMSYISRLSGMSDAVGGGLATTLNKTGRRQVFNNNLPGLAILALYQFIPAGPKVEPGFESLANIMGSSDDLLQYCPAAVKSKRRSSLLSFWDMGDWADWNVGVEVFPKMKEQLTAMLGMDPQNWWRKQLGANRSMGFIDPNAVADAANQGADTLAKITTTLKNIIGAVGKLFGGTDFRWLRGDPSTWAPNTSDWNSYPTNPLKNLNLEYNTGTGVISPGSSQNVYPASYGSGTAITPGGYIDPNQYAQQPAQANSNTKILLWVGGGLLVAKLFKLI